MNVQFDIQNSWYVFGVGAGCVGCNAANFACPHSSSAAVLCAGCMRAESSLWRGVLEFFCVLLLRLLCFTRL